MNFKYLVLGLGLLATIGSFNQARASQFAAIAIRDVVSKEDEMITRLFSTLHLKLAYAHAEYFQKRDTSDEAITDAIQRALERYDAVDIFLLSHTNQMEDLVKPIPAHLRQKLRLVYNTGCTNARDFRPWLDLGAKSFVGHAGISFSPIFYARFIERWKSGARLLKAVRQAAAYTKSTLLLTPTWAGDREAVLETYLDTKAYIYGDRKLTIRSDVHPAAAESGPKIDPSCLSDSRDATALNAASNLVKGLEIATIAQTDVKKYSDEIALLLAKTTITCSKDFAVKANGPVIHLEPGAFATTKEAQYKILSTLLAQTTAQSPPSKRTRLDGIDFKHICSPNLLDDRAKVLAGLATDYQFPEYQNRKMSDLIRYRMNHCGYARGCKIMMMNEGFDDDYVHSWGLDSYDARKACDWMFTRKLQEKKAIPLKWLETNLEDALPKAENHLPKRLIEENAFQGGFSYLEAFRNEGCFKGKYQRNKETGDLWIAPEHFKEVTGRSPVHYGNNKLARVSFNVTPALKILVNDLKSSLNSMECADHHLFRLWLQMFANTLEKVAAKTATLAEDPIHSILVRAYAGQPLKRSELPFYTGHEYPMVNLGFDAISIKDSIIRYWDEEIGKSLTMFPEKDRDVNKMDLADKEQ